MGKRSAVLLAAVSMLALPLAASAASLSASCTGAPGAASITWSGTASGGIAPLSFLWGNGSTSTSQTITVSPGTYSMTFQATDASSTAATTTCSATVAAPAATPTSIADQITALLNQIAALKAQIAQLLVQQVAGGLVSSAATSTPECFTFNHNIGQGDEGDDVKDLQTTLASDPSIFPPGLVTGFFGHRTEEAVKKFQEKFGITSTGFFGPKSREFFHEQCSRGDANGNGVPDSIETEDESEDGSGMGTSTMQLPMTSEHGDGQQRNGGHGDRGNDGDN